MFKYEFFPNKKMFDYSEKSKIKSLLKYTYYFFLNLISYPKNLYSVIKIILNNKND